MRLRHALGLALALTLTHLGPRARAADLDEPPLVEYRAREGDTLSGLARRFYGNPKRVDLLLRYNDLGQPPYRLRPGQALRVLPDAWLAAASGVELLAPRAAPLPGRPGAVLARATRVRTGAGGSAVVEFNDATRVQLAEASTLLIAGAEPGQVPGLARADDTTLLAGALRITRPAGAARTVLATPTARLLMAGGEALLRIEGDGREGRTQISALSGELRVSGAERTVWLRAGEGVTLGPDGRPRAPRPLPGPPEWTAPPPPLLLSLGGAAEVTGAFAAGRGPAAARWHVQVAHDERFQDLVLDLVQPEARLAQPVPPGRYHARVAAISDDDASLEGPASARGFEVAEAHVLPAEGGQPARLRVPPGLFCSLDGGEAAAVYAPLPLAPGRRHTARCALQMGGPAAELTVDGGRAAALAHELELGPARFDSGRGSRRVTLRLRDGAGQPLRGQRVLARPEGEATAGAITEAGPGAYACTVEWPQRERPGTLRFVVNDAIEIDAPLPAVSPPAARPAAQERPTGPAFELSAGASLFLGDPTLGPGRGGFLEIGRRLPLPFGALGLAARASVEDFSFRDEVRAPCRPDGGNPPMVCFESGGGAFAYLLARTTLTVSVPVSYRLRAAERAIVPYVGLAPQLVFDWTQTQAIGLANRATLSIHGGVHALAGVVVRPWRARWAALLFEGGYRQVSQEDRRKEDAPLSGGTLLIGVRGER